MVAAGTAMAPGWVADGTVAGDFSVASAFDGCCCGSPLVSHACLVCKIPCSSGAGVPAPCSSSSRLLLAPAPLPGTDTAPGSTPPGTWRKDLSFSSGIMTASSKELSFPFGNRKSTGENLSMDKDDVPQQWLLQQ